VKSSLLSFAAKLVEDGTSFEFVVFVVVDDDDGEEMGDALADTVVTECRGVNAA